MAICGYLCRFLTLRFGTNIAHTPVTQAKREPMNCSQKEIERQLPQPKRSRILYVAFESAGKYFDFAYKCLISRLLERWELTKEEVWDNFAILTLKGQEQFFFISESKFRRVKCVCWYTNGFPDALRQALVRVTQSVSWRFPQIKADVLLQSTSGLIATEKEVRLAKEVEETNVSLPTAQSKISCSLDEFRDFFSARDKVDTYVVHDSATYRMVSSVRRELGNNDVQCLFGTRQHINLSAAEKSATMVVQLTRHLLERADNPLSDVAQALEMGFRKAPGCVFPLIVDSELLNVDNWPCTPFNLHQIPFIDFSTTERRAQNVELLAQSIKSKLKHPKDTVEQSQQTEDNSSDI